MKKIILIFFAVIGNLSFSQCTYHLPDLLILENDTIMFQKSPLYSHPKIDFQKLFLEKGIKPLGWGNTKNFQAEWKIIENKLYLSDIYSCNYLKDNYKADLKDLFKKKHKNGLVHADWYSNTLYAPKGEHIWLGASPGCKIHKSELEFTFKNGVLVKSDVSNNNFFKSIYTENTQNLIEFIEKNIDLREVIVSDKEIIRFTITIKTGSSKNDFSINIKGDIKENNKNEIIKIVKQLPNFDYYHSQGKDYNIIFPFGIAYKKLTD